MKKILLLTFTLLLAVISLSLSINSVFAQTESAKIRDVEELVKEREQNQVQDQSYNPQNLDMGTNPDVPKNLSTYTQSVFIEIVSATSCLISGVDPIRQGHPCLGFDPETKKIGYIENSGGALGLMGNMIAATYDIPASGADYIQYLAGNFGISQNANAAVSVDGNPCIDNPSLCEEGNGSALSFGTGNGFDNLRPLLSIWTKIRNLVYLLFVLVFIVLGLGIMFRIQIDPRAVMSIQSQLPKIVIALVLVTFSYAIAGFFVDMMYLSLFLIINLFDSPGLGVSTTLDTNPINAAGGLGSGGIGGIAANAAKGVSSALGSLFDGGAPFSDVFKKIINFIVNPVGTVAGGFLGGIPVIGSINNTINSVISGALDMAGLGIKNAFMIIVGAIAWVIIAIALLSALFRLWFTLIKTYVFILINITFSPVWIAFGLIPGSSLSFGNWIRSLASDLAVFPIVLVLFSLGRTFQDAFSNASQYEAFVPPYIGDPGNMSAFSSIIAMGIILLAPEAVNMSKSIFKAPDSKLTGSVGRSLGVGQGAVGSLGGSIKKSLWYTNPHTGEPGRLKALAGEKTSEYLDKTPGIGKVKRYFTDKFETKKSKEARNKADKEREAQIARDATLSNLASGLSKIVPPTSPSSPTSEPPTPVNPDESGDRPEPEGGPASPQQPSPSTDEENSGGGPQGGQTT